MVDKTSIILDKALGNGGNLDVVLSNKAQCTNLRRKIYRTRWALKKKLAVIEGLEPEEVTTEYDDLVLRIKRKENQWILEIREERQASLKLICPNTGISI